ncbi:MAG: hypothetical protein EOM05_05505 [Clostridia bacterium]|nr:hypothetical protein [Clostridia bacterium]
MKPKSDIRLWNFDYLKFFCVLWVILTHSDFTDDQREMFLFPYMIDMAVPIFMIITGYMSSLSIEKRQIKITRQYFTSGTALRKIQAVLLPFVFAYVLEVFIYLAFFDVSINKYFLLELLKYDNMGPGSYYTPVLIQLLLLFPIIYFFYIKKPVVTSIVVVATEVIFEVYKTSSDMPIEIYRLICLRYIVCILLGIILYHNRECLRNKIYYLVAIPSIAFIYVVSYTEYETYVFDAWITTAMPTNLWAFVLVLLGINYFKKLPNMLHKVVTRIGRGTYYIFLTQMVWFSFELDKNISSLTVAVLLNIFVCISGGLLVETIANKTKKIMCNKKIKIKE